MIDKFVIDRLEATPIEGVAERLGLEVNRHKCLCPFHDDSRPSLTFNTYRNRYRCYVCDAHGGVIDLVKNYRGVGFREACEWLDPSIVRSDFAQKGLTLLCKKNVQTSKTLKHETQKSSPAKRVYPPDLEWLSSLIRVKSLNEEARRFLFEERKIDPRVVAWCGLTSISEPQPCWRYGKPFYDAPSLLIPYYDVDGRLVSVQSRYLGTTLSERVPLDRSEASAERELPSIDRELSVNTPRFRFPRGSDCHVYGLQILRMLKPGEELWITEGASDCWAMLSSGKKAIAIPSATLLKEKDIEPLRRVIAPPSAGGLGGSLHMYPDQDRPGEKLFLELRERLPGIERHQLPEGCKDFGDLWKTMQTGRN